MSEEATSELAPLTPQLIESPPTSEQKQMEVPCPGEPINSAEFAVPSELKITTPSVSIEEASTNSQPKVTSTPMLNPRQQNLSDSSKGLPILPQGMKTKTPTWENIKYFFRNVYRVVITEGTQVLETLLKGMLPLHYKVLELIGVPPSTYDNLINEWWRFQEC